MDTNCYVTFLCTRTYVFWPSVSHHNNSRTGNRTTLKPKYVCAYVAILSWCTGWGTCWHTHLEAKLFGTTFVPWQTLRTSVIWNVMHAAWSNVLYSKFTQWWLDHLVGVIRQTNSMGQRPWRADSLLAG